jgi:hypothetical protein
MRALDCGRYGACSSMVASWHSASLSTPVSQHGVAESLAAAGFAQAQIVDRSKLFCALATKP